MAGEGKAVGGKVSKAVELADHPLVLTISLVFVIVPAMALLNWGFTQLGWPGPASLFKNP